MEIMEAISSLALEVLNGGRIYNNKQTMGCLVPSDCTSTPVESHDVIIDAFSTDEMVVAHYLRYIRKDKKIIIELFYNKYGFGAISDVFPFKSYSVDFDGKVESIE